MEAALLFQLQFKCTCVSTITQVPDFPVNPVGGGDSTTLHAILAEGKPIVLDIYAEW